MSSLQERLRQYEAVASGSSKASDDHVSTSPVKRSSSREGNVEKSPVALPGLANESAQARAGVKSPTKTYGGHGTRTQPSGSLQERMKALAAGSDPSSGASGYATASIGATIAAASAGYQQSSNGGTQKISVKDVAARADKSGVGTVPKYEEFHKPRKSFDAPRYQAISGEDDEIKGATKGAATAAIGQEIANHVSKSGGKINVKSIVDGMQRSSVDSLPKPTSETITPTTKNDTSESQLDDLRQKNKVLESKIRELTIALAEETAKALENDEWVCKLTKELESLQEQTK